ncbi:hypothetical protein FA09DRAFT_329569 [Tilletiopsis washingtonensis]|uniref:C3H1-type domain-containing protein n=1 Tax=Tilletiopsis washingtonensis TaxID=58919 RepID=A0A316ZB41_9BASI|nr:hypothetical protein FA09DRAFT_329569 [Tilletiopsis washingtonensis]PWN98516.1 hypothetical protein FA09DRAFT_329569 [Tilletiopsis washingtonensis]
MPPKKADKKQNAPKKVVEDKTFGMKNKKGAKAQQQVKIIQQQQSQAGKTPAEMLAAKKREEEKKAKLEAEKQRKKDMEDVLIIQPKVPFGVDPKTITCEFWKAGKCEKSAARCKFAHTNDASRKVEKKDLYTDMREGEGGEEDKKTDTMDKWDQAKLDRVVLSKHGNTKSTTDKVCKFFLQAVEEGKYGWFWVCPNGGDDCFYKHRLPPGFVLKSQKREREEAEKALEISLEEFLETARHKLGSNLTPVTAETFAEWKRKRMDKKEAEEEAMANKKATQAAANKMAGLSGREMFTLNPDFYDDGDDGGDEEFELAGYMKDYNQERQSDDEDSAGESDDDEEGTARGGSTNGDAASQHAAKEPMQDARARVAGLSINGDEGEEEGRRKNGATASVSS